MIVVINKRAFNALIKVANFVESQNTLGSGDRWWDKTMLEIDSLAQSKAKFAICNNESLRKFKYHCYPYGDWVIVHRLIGQKFIVYKFIQGSRLK